MSDVEIELAGEPALLMGERALFLPAHRALLIADPHWGKTASFRAAALAVPEGGLAADLGRLDRALARSGAERLVVLGDLLHARSGRDDVTISAVTAWRAARPGLLLTLVRGNHDLGAGDPPAEWGCGCVDEPYPLGPFALCHRPDVDAPGYRLAGHLHPAVSLVGPGRQRERLPCFLLGPRAGLLPAFGSFTGAATLRPAPADRVFVVADGQVIALP